MRLSRTIISPGSPSRDPFGAWRPAAPAAQRQPPSPYDEKLNLAAVAWMNEIPAEVAPQALASQFPRIVNRLARFWDSPRMVDSYLEDLLVDRRGKRQGFPKKVLQELYALAEYHRHRRAPDMQELQRATSDVWDSIPYRS